MSDFLVGPSGQPTLLVSDRGSREVALASERRQKLDAEVKAAVAEIRRSETVRAHQPRPSVAELADGMRANAALAREQRQAPGRVLEEFRDLERELLAVKAADAAASPPAPTRWHRENDYSNDLHEWLAANR